MARPKVLVVTRHSPLPDNDGAGAYLFDLLKYLADRGARVQIVWVATEGHLVRKGYWRVPSRVSAVADLHIIGSLAVGPYRFFWWGPLEAQILGALKKVLLRLGLWRKKTSAWQAALGPPPAADVKATNVGQQPDWSALPTGLETRFFRKRLRQFRPDVVLANYCWMTPLFSFAPQAQKLVLAHDVASQRLGLLSTTLETETTDLSPATRTGEAKLLDQADHVLAISEDDATEFRAMLSPDKILVVPKAAATRTLSGPPISGRCLFVGGANEPNREGILWFLENVWPTVVATRPESQLHICGAICSSLPTNLPAGVKALGRVPDLTSQYREAEVVVVPLLRGTGVKIKLVEACSFAKACVTTPVGLQGLSFLRDAVLESQDASEFTRAVLRLLADSQLRSLLQTRTAEAVRTHLSTDTCYASAWEAVVASPRQLRTKESALKILSPA